MRAEKKVASALTARANARALALPEAEVLDALIAAAIGVRERAYAPYSKYHVGAALYTAKGGLFTGCNVENASYGGAICAERGAVMKMISEGDRQPIACAVATGGPSPGSPCGFCRQVLAEFALDMPIALVAVSKTGKILKRRDTSLAVLLPDAFRSFEP